MEREVKILKADWIVPVSSPPLKNGAVVIENDRILAVGPENSIIANFTGKVEDYNNAVIAPAWVNAHTHLELSFLNYSQLPKESFVDWVRAVVSSSPDNAGENYFEYSVNKACQMLDKAGTSLVGDITNGALLESLDLNGKFERVVFYELVGFQEKKVQEIFDTAMRILQNSSGNAFVSPHALHSVSRSLLSKINDQGNPFSIHMAESVEETQLIKSGQGPFYSFLKEREVWDESWKIPAQSPVEYAYEMGLVRDKALFVHCVNVSKQDLDIIKANGARICLCPRSNMNLNVGVPPVNMIIEKGIPFCVGTDSLASNTDLDVSQELFYLAEKCGIYNWNALVRAGTLTGAEALSKNNSYGSIQPGKKAHLNVYLGATNNPEEFIITRQWSDTEFL